MYRTLVSALAVLLLGAGTGGAQDGPPVVRLTVRPAGPPVPVLKYPLLPPLRELRAGNAALYYQRTHSPEWWPNLVRYPDFPKFTEWLELPLDKAPVENAYGGVVISILRELDVAARTEHCDWQMLGRLREDGPAFLIPDMQGFRTLAELNALRTRYEIKTGKLDDAVRSLQSGLALAEHVGEAPTVVTSLIALRCAHLTLDRVEEFIARPGAPNLYWSLTDLPRPLLSLRRPLQGERVMVDSVMPEVRKALRSRKAVAIPPETLRSELRRLAMFGAAADPLDWAISTAANYPRARRYFLEAGRTAEELAPLPVAQVALMYALTQYDVWADEFDALNGLPYWELRPRVKEIHDRWLATDKGYRDSLGLFGGILHMPERIYLHQARLQRRIEMLRCVEALRLHAAAGGELPPSLEDLRAVPVPTDPMTGKAFAYSRTGNRAVLEGAPPPGEPPTQFNTVRIEITLIPAPKGG